MPTIRSVICPLVFTKTSKPQLALLQEMGLGLVAYIDDILILAESKGMALDHVEALVYLLECLGFVINKEKLVEFLGLIGNSVNMELRFLLQNMNDSGGVSKIAEERCYLGSHPGPSIWEKECNSVCNSPSSSLLLPPANGAIQRVRGRRSVFDKVLWCTKWHRKVLFSPVE